MFSYTLLPWMQPNAYAILPWMKSKSSPCIHDPWILFSFFIFPFSLKEFGSKGNSTLGGGELQGVSNFKAQGSKEPKLQELKL